MHYTLHIALPSAQKLYLVFEYLDKDLKKLLDDHNAAVKSQGGPATGLPGNNGTAFGGRGFDERLYSRFIRPWKLITPNTSLQNRWFAPTCGSFWRGWPTAISIGFFTGTAPAPTHRGAYLAIW